MAAAALALPLLALALALPAAFGGSAAEPNPIYEAASYRKLVGDAENGRLYAVEAPDNTQLLELHVFGDAKQRGFAQGVLLADHIESFIWGETGLDEYYKDQVDQIPLGKLPEWLQDTIKKIGKALAPTAFHLALGYVYEREQKYIGASKANYWEEMDALAEGLCSVKNASHFCKDLDEAKKRIHITNMLPELVRMQCSMLGAWGDATEDGHLVQMRTLDFGAGPFANHSVLVVSHPDGDAPAFASLAFPAFVGAVTGFSESIGLSEKVDDLASGGVPKGSYEGVADVFVIRDMLQFARTKEDAVSIAQDARRTWGVWLGVGDFASEEFVAMDYQQAHATPYDDQSLPSRTNQTLFKDIAYLDKHPQPSTHPELPDLLKEYYGRLTAPAVVQNIPRGTQSGDVHAAIYDFGKKEVYIAVGLVAANMTDYIRKAHDSPFVRFNMTSLWEESKP